jgi:glycerol-3-phosphate dehydrogenase
MARSVEDVLARRLRALFLDARAAIEMAPAVASLVGDELGWDAERRAREIEDFRRLAEGYMLA